MLLLTIKSFAKTTFFVFFVILFTNSVYSGKTENNALALINTGNNSDRPLISANGNIMFFNSDKKTEPNEEFYTYDWYEKCYRYDYNIFFSIKTNGIWSEPINIKGINTEFDDGVLSISPDGNTIYFVSFNNEWYLNGGPIYKAELRGNEFTNVKGLGENITNFFFYSIWNEYDSPNGTYLSKCMIGATISPDGKELFFASDISAQFGKTDISVSNLTNGIWTYPKNLGPTINIKGAVNREPYIAYDNKTLFYSTNGLKGFGKSDLYYSVRKNGEWTKPENLGNFVNSRNEDTQITIPALGNEVYLVSKVNEKNIITCKELPKDIKWLPSYSLLTGKVFDADTKEPVEVDIEILNTDLGMVSYTTWNNLLNGDYTLIMQQGANYRITFLEKDYIPISITYDFTKNNEITISKYNIELKKINVEVPKSENVSILDNVNSNEHNLNCIYPNPAHDIINIDPGEYILEEFDITIINLSWIEFYRQEKINSKSSIYQIELNDLPNGLYFVEIITPRGRKILKFIKE